MARFIKIGLCLLFIALICSEIAGKKPPKDQDRKKDKPLDKIRALAKIVFEKGEMVWSFFEQIGESLMPHSDFGDDDDDDDSDSVNKKINKFSSQLSDFKNELFQRLNVKSNIQELKDRNNHMITPMTHMENFMTRFESLTNFSSTIKISSLEQFAKDVDSDDSQIGPQFQLKLIHNFLMENAFNKNFFNLLADPQLVKEFMCPTGQSIQQFIRSIYQKFVLLEVYGYMMIIYGANIKKALKKQTDKWLLEKETAALQGYYYRVGKMFKETKLALADSSREVWRADPKIHKEGETYKRLEPIFQKYIAHETDAWRPGMPSYHQKCDTTCEALDNKRHWTCSSDVCKKQEKKRCNGNLQDCKFIADPTICFSNDPYRRYESIETEGKVFGKASACKNDEFEGEGHLNFVDPSRLNTNLPKAFVETFKALASTSHCSYCLCTCDSGQFIGDRYIHIKPVMADIDDNKVITGVQFVFVSQILHIQIQQGVLAPYGLIKNNTTKWKPVHEFEYYDEGILEGVDYAMITWKNRTVLLDELHPPNDMNNTVLVGLQIQGGKSNEFRLKLYLKEFDFKTGILKKELPSVEVNNEWSDESETERTEVEIDHPEVPTNYHQHQPNKTEANKYVKFTTTDLKKDAGQNVIPFIDIQPVITNPPVPISGAGLILKSEKDSGGFLALELFTLNIEPYLHRQDLPNAS